MTYQILRHSFFQVTNNFRMVVFHSLPLAAIVLLSVVSWYQFRPSVFAPEAMQSIGAVSLGLILTGIFALMWLAVNFHIAILTPEDNVTVGTRIGRSFGYIGRTIMLSFIIGIPLMIVSMILLQGLVPALSNSPSVINLIFSIPSVIFVWLLYRLSPILPAGAIGKPISMSEAWLNTAIFGRALLGLTLVGIGLDYLSAIVFGSLPFAPQIALSAFVDWFLLVLGVSIYTTLYGVSIEGRELV